MKEADLKGCVLYDFNYLAFEGLVYYGGSKKRSALPGDRGKERVNANTGFTQGSETTLVIP